MALTGRLVSGSDAPNEGERTSPVARIGGVVVEQVLSGRLDGPVGYDQDHDEWVLLIEGGATLEVEGELTHLVAGDWVLLPAHTRHRLLDVQPGTSWLTLSAS